MDYVIGIKEYEMDAMFEYELAEIYDGYLDGAYDEVNEMLALFASAGLALPGFMKGIGWLYKKLNNVFSKNKITETNIEKYADRLHKWIMKVIRLMIKPMTSIFGLDEKQSEAVATAVMMAIVVSLAGAGAVSIFGGMHGYDLISGSVKVLSQLVKQGEIATAVMAVCVLVTHKKSFTDINDALHSTEKCIGEVGIGKPKKVIQCAGEEEH